MVPLDDVSMHTDKINLEPEQVRPVTRGVRTSLVLWLQGRGGVTFESDAIASHTSAIASCECISQSNPITPLHAW